MDTYIILLTLKLEHNYYADNRCRALTLCSKLSGKLSGQQTPDSRKLIWSSNKDKDEWSLIGRNDEVFDAGEALEVDMQASDPFFRYFTKWTDDGAGNQFHLTVDGTQLPIELPFSAGSFEQSAELQRIGRVTIPLSLLPPPAADRKALEITLSFQTVERYWEYFFVPRNENAADRELLLTDNSGQLTFTEMEPSSFGDYRAWRCVSDQPVQLKDKYRLQLRLSEKTPFGNRPLLKQVPPPAIGQFVSGQQFITQVCYF